jgi:hypothetical protein
VVLEVPHELHGVLMGAIASEGWNAGALASSQQLAFVTNEQVYGSATFDARTTLELIQQTCKESRALGFSGVRGAGHPPVHNTAAVLAYETGLCDLHKSQATLTSLCMYSKAQTEPNTLRDLITVHPQILLSDRLCNNTFFDPNAFRDDRAPNDARHLDWIIHQLLRSRDPRDETDVTDPATLRMQIEHYRRAAVNLSRGIDLRDRVIGMIARQLRHCSDNFSSRTEGVAIDPHDAQEALERASQLSQRLEAVAGMLSAPTPLQPRTVDLGGLLSDCVARISADEGQGKGPISLKTEASVLGRFDVEASASAIEICLRLALRHGCGGPVQLSADKQGQVARISIRYHGLDGAGAAAALSGKAGNQELYDWLGIDLFFARELVRRMNGVLTVASWPDDAVLFTIELPRNTPSSFGDVFA